MRKLKFLILATVVAAIVGVAAAAGPAYYMQAQTVRGSQNATGPTCVLTPVFKTGEQIVFLAEVYSTQTGKVVTPAEAKQLGMKVTVKTEDGKTIDLEYGQHPAHGTPKIWMWAGAFVIPPVYPTGVFKYTITVTDKNGNTATWSPLQQDYPGGYSSLITIAKR